MKIKDGKDYIAQVKGLIAEYTKRLLSFQQLDAELPEKKPKKAK